MTNNNYRTCSICKKKSHINSGPTCLHCGGHINDFDFLDPFIRFVSLDSLPRFERTVIFTFLFIVLFYVVGVGVNKGAVEPSFFVSVMLVAIVLFSYFISRPSRKERESKIEIETCNEKMLGGHTKGSTVVYSGSIVQITSGNIELGSPRLTNSINLSFRSWYFYEEKNKDERKLVLISGEYGKDKTYKVQYVLNLSDKVKTINLITTDTKTDSNMLKGGLIGGALMGPIGAAAGAALSRSNKTYVVFECEMISDKHFTGITDPTTYSKIIGCLNKSITDAKLLNNNAIKEFSSQSLNEDEARCYYCAETIKKEARICRYCNRDIYLIEPAD